MSGMEASSGSAPPPAVTAGTGSAWNIPGEVMTWTGGLPLGLYKSVRTFTLSAHAAMTHLRVTEQHTGPLAGFLGKPAQDMQRSFADYVGAVKTRAELFG